KLKMAGLDVTHQFLITAARRAEVRAVGGELADFTADLLEYFSQAYAKNFGVPAEGPLHDPCAVLAVSDPAMFTANDYHVAVETDSDLTRGQTIVDRRPGGILSRKTNASVLENIDDDAAFGAVIAAITERSRKG